MRLFLYAFAAVATFALLLSGGSAEAKEKGTFTGTTISERVKFIDKESPYVVQIFTSMDRGASAKQDISSGTGFVYQDENGRFAILTNSHVLGPLSNEYAWIAFEKDNTARKARIIGRDPILDVALIEMPADRPRHVLPAHVNFSFVSLEVGDEVYALGYPFGNREVTMGWVNALTAPGEHWFFSSQVPLHPGNSGGPLLRFSQEGKPEVIGVNTAISGIGLKSMSIHIRYVGRVLPRLWRESIVNHAMLGIAMEDSRKIPPPFFEMMVRMPYPPRENGIMVLNVQDGSPAGKAGLKVGDIIAKAMFKGFDLSFRNARELLEIIFFDLRPGDMFFLSVKRGQQILEKTVVLDEHVPRDERQEAPSRGNQ